MIEFIWYLPSGSGGMAAWAKSSKIRRALDDWYERYNIARRYKSDIYSVNGLRYLKQTFNEPDAVLFALTWDQTISHLRYEYSLKVEATVKKG